MLKNPLVSIIINCYNGDKYLEEAINSVYSQTYNNWEIIFWDNKSDDNSAIIAKSFDRVRYFLADEHTSLGAARNKAVNVSNGELISFLDCDDLWLENKLELQVEKMNSGNFSMCYGGCIEIDEKGKTIRSLMPKYKDGYMLENLLLQWDISMPAIIVRKSSLLKYNLSFDDNIFASEEYCLFMQLAAKTQFCSVKESIVKWRIRENSLTSQQISRLSYERKYTLDKIIENNPGIDKKYKKAFNEAYARGIFYQANYFMSIGNKKNARNCMKSIRNVDYKYYLLFLCLFFPSIIWNIITNEKFKRKYLAYIFNISKFND